MSLVIPSPKSPPGKPEAPYPEGREMTATGELATTGATISMSNEALQQLLIQVQAGQLREPRKLKVPDVEEFKGDLTQI